MKTHSKSVKPFVISAWTPVAGQFFLFGLILMLAGCADPPNKGLGPPKLDAQVNEETTLEPNFVTVQHCLIGFAGSVDKASRSKKKARELAVELLARAKNGEDFDAIVKEYTDDSHPGIYRMANFGIQGDTNPALDPSERTFKRDEMAAAFGDVGFKLKVGEFDMSEYSKKYSPFGYHIIKRIE